jgi:hypothetical protein
MKTVWFKGIVDAQLKEDIRASYKSSLVARRRLAEMLAAKIEEKLKSDQSVDGYDCPNWAYKVADSQGYNRALNEVISIIMDKNTHKS